MTADEAAVALGASHVADLPRVPESPEEALELAIAARERLRPAPGRRTGRPTNAEWTMRRLVPFSERTWAALEECASQASTPNRRVSPGQVAAEILERALTPRG